ncbi:glycosyl hydrolase [Lipomyces doorenjongii]|uniref:glycosyl hydrolase n=1 Tax=Lipomyces doorenjongii TaxID=383834 RepID=UPI0034CFA191
MTDQPAYDEPARPQVHFSPPKGFMNDPNGLVYSNGTWHMYFQYDPNCMVAGKPQWGHATSQDLIHWKNHGLAIESENADGSIYSGSAVVDKENTSGLFDDSIDPEERIVAIYTSHSPKKQVQCVAFSRDGGYTFASYQQNPVIDIGSKDFRDPKVFFHKPSSKWIMAVALSHEYQILFYGSKDLLHWTELSRFQAGLVGYQYEVPDLVEMPIEGTTATKWVLFVSINPGAPLGGSMTQYFIGEFDGEKFIPDDYMVRFADYGKDWYASQTWSNTPGNEVIGLAWASNWQYTNEVPTYPWRGCMSVARRMLLRKVRYNQGYFGYSLAQFPVNIERARNLDNAVTADSVDSSTGMKLCTKSGAAELLFYVSEVSLGNRFTDSSTILIELASKSARISIGLRAFETGLHVWLNRNADAAGWHHPLYNDNLSALVIPEDMQCPVYKIHGIIDRGLTEIYVNDVVAFTNIHVFADDEFADTVRVKLDDNLRITQASIYELHSAWTK